MSAKSWTAIVTERNTFLDVEYCDDAPHMESLRRYVSEPDLASCWRHTNGTCKKNSIVMVSQFAGLPQKFSDDEPPSKGFESQRVSKTPAWHLREFDDEELALFGNYFVPMENLLEDPRQSDDEEIGSFDVHVPMENLSDGSNLPRKKTSRPCKGQRMRDRTFTEKMLGLLRNDPDNFELDDVSMPPSLATGNARKQRIVTYLQTEKERILKNRETDRMLPQLMVGQRQ